MTPENAVAEIIQVVDSVVADLKIEDIPENQSVSFYFMLTSALYFAYSDTFMKFRVGMAIKQVLDYLPEPHKSFGNQIISMLDKELLALKKKEEINE